MAGEILIEQGRSEGSVQTMTRFFNMLGLKLRSSGRQKEQNSTTVNQPQGHRVSSVRC